MLYSLRIAGLFVAGAVLAACGGGGGDVPATAGVEARLAAARVGIIDKAKCEKPGSANHLENGECIERFAGIAGATPAPLAAHKDAPLRQASVPSMSALFAWAAGAYPQYFYGGYTDGSLFVGFPFNGTFQYRAFGSGNIIGVLGTSVYAYGWVTSNAILYIGELSDFSCSVYSCGGGGGGGGGGGTSLSVGGSVSSAFYSSGGYVDHSIYLYAGSSYTFDLMGGTLPDPYLELYSPGGSLVTSDDDTGDGLNARIYYTATSTGYYTLRARYSPYGVSAGSSGSYTLSAAYTSGSGGGSGGGGGGTGGGNSGGSLSVGSYVTGAFYVTNGYVDHSIYLYAGSTYSFSAVGSSLGDPYLRLYSPSGTLVGSDDDSGDGYNALLTYTAGATGYYTLRVSSALSGYGSYTLYATSGSSSGGGGGGSGGGSGGSGSYITWTNSDNGVVVVDANNEHFAFDSGSRCLYSYNMNQTTTNFCLYAGSASGSFAGQAVQVLLVAASGGGCIAALADPSGYQIDIYTNNGVQTVTRTNSMYNTAGCTY